MKKIIKLIVSVFGIGYLPFMPGTMASLAAAIFFYFCGNSKAAFFVLLVSGILGFTFGAKAEEIFRKKDAGVIVIDEFFAMLLILFFIKPNLIQMMTAFIFFRLADIFKFWHIKKIERLKGAWGIMLDDCLAAVYTVLIVKIGSFLIFKILKL